MASDPGAMSEEQEAKRKRDEEALEPHLAPVHQCAWEEDILWGDGDDDGDSDGEPAAKPGEQQSSDAVDDSRALPRAGDDVRCSVNDSRDETYRGIVLSHHPC